MIVVDTSVWVQVMRRPASPAAATFRQLLDSDEIALALPVRFELLSGIARKDRTAFKRALAGLPVLRPTDETWRVIETWVEPAANAGFRFSVTDLLVAGMAHEIEALVWTLDSDFAPMETLGFVQLYA